MSRATVTVDAKGRITLPPDVRGPLHIEAGDKVDVSLDGTSGVVIPEHRRCCVCGTSEEGVGHGGFVEFGDDPVRVICGSCAGEISIAIRRTIRTA